MLDNYYQKQTGINLDRLLPTLYLVATYETGCSYLKQLEGEYPNRSHLWEHLLHAGSTLCRIRKKN